MLGLMMMNNPMWEWVLAPILLVMLGYGVGWFARGYEVRDLLRLLARYHTKDDTYE